MFTRFCTPSAAFVFDAPLIRVAHTCPGAPFLTALGGAYETEERHLRSRLIQHTVDLQSHLASNPTASTASVKKFARALRLLLEFLGSISDTSVDLYSYDSLPSIDEILAAFSEGSGANDWALEEIRRRGNKGRKLLLSALTPNSDKAPQFSAVAMLLTLFHEPKTVTAIHKFTETVNADTAREVSLLLAAYDRDSLR